MAKGQGDRPDFSSLAPSAVGWVSLPTACHTWPACCDSGFFNIEFEMQQLSDPPYVRYQATIIIDRQNVAV